MKEFNVISRSRSISDDDLCASCIHLEYNAVRDSVCCNPDFEPVWKNMCNEDGFVVTCDLHYELTEGDTAMLNELYDLTLIEYEDVKLTDVQENRYVELVSTLKSKNIEIPFGVEV